MTTSAKDDCDKPTKLDKPKAKDAPAPAPVAPTSITLVRLGDARTLFCTRCDRGHTVGHAEAVELCPLTALDLLRDEPWAWCLETEPAPSKKEK